MAKIRNISGEDRVVPWLDNRLVAKGAVVEVPKDDVYAYTQQAGVWEPGDKEAQGLHDAARKVERVAIEHPADGTFAPEIRGDGAGTALPEIGHDNNGGTDR